MSGQNSDLGTLVIPSIINVVCATVANFAGGDSKKSLFCFSESTAALDFTASKVTADELNHVLSKAVSKLRDEQHIVDAASSTSKVDTNATSPSVLSSVSQLCKGIAEDEAFLAYAASSFAAADGTNNDSPQTTEKSLAFAASTLGTRILTEYKKTANKNANATPSSRLASFSKLVAAFALLVFATQSASITAAAANANDNASSYKDPNAVEDLTPTAANQSADSSNAKHVDADAFYQLGVCLAALESTVAAFYTSTTAAGDNLAMRNTMDCCAALLRQWLVFQVPSALVKLANDSLQRFETQEDAKEKKAKEEEENAKKKKVVADEEVIEGNLTFPLCIETRDDSDHLFVALKPSYCAIQCLQMSGGTHLSPTLSSEGIVTVGGGDNGDDDSEVALESAWLLLAESLGPSDCVEVGDAKSISAKSISSAAAASASAGASTGAASFLRGAAQPFSGGAANAALLRTLGTAPATATNAANASSSSPTPPPPQTATKSLNCPYFGEFTKTGAYVEAIRCFGGVQGSLIVSEKTGTNPQQQKQHEERRQVALLNKVWLPLALSMLYSTTDESLQEEVLIAVKASEPFVCEADKEKIYYKIAEVEAAAAKEEAKKSKSHDDQNKAKTKKKKSVNPYIKLNKYDMLQRIIVSNRFASPKAYAELGVMSRIGFTFSERDCSRDFKFDFERNGGAAEEDMFDTIGEEEDTTTSSLSDAQRKQAMAAKAAFKAAKSTANAALSSLVEQVLSIAKKEFLPSAVPAEATTKASQAQQQPSSSSSSAELLLTLNEQLLVAKQVAKLKLCVVREEAIEIGFDCPITDEYDIFPAGPDATSTASTPLSLRKMDAFALSISLEPRDAKVWVSYALGLEDKPMSHMKEEVSLLTVGAEVCKRLIHTDGEKKKFFAANSTAGNETFARNRWQNEVFPALLKKITIEYQLANASANKTKAAAAAPTDTVRSVMQFDPLVYERSLSSSSSSSSNSSKVTRVEALLRALAIDCGDAKAWYVLGTALAERELLQKDCLLAEQRMKSVNGNEGGDGGGGAVLLLNASDRIDMHLAALKAIATTSNDAHGNVFQTSIRVPKSILPFAVSSDEDGENNSSTNSGEMISVSARECFRAAFTLVKQAKLVNEKLPSASNNAPSGASVVSLISQFCRKHNYEL